jgi:predicted NUDIX family phosphoesterase
MEFVFVVPRNSLFPEFYPHGLVPFEAQAQDAFETRTMAHGDRGTRAGGASELSLAEFEASVAREGFFVERAYAERRPELKQLIPYSIVECGGRVLLVRRLSGGGESRLHNKHSIGIGGHINPEDLGQGQNAAALRNPIDAGTRRELEEELTVRGTYQIRRVGLLNDDSNSVGAVHVGVVQVITIDGSVEIRERDQLEGRLVAPDDLRSMLVQGANFETWSRLLVPHLDELLPKPFAVSP